MLRFLRDLFSRPRLERTVILLQPGVAKTPRQHRVVPLHAIIAGVGLVILLCALMVAAFLFTPFRGLCGRAASGTPCSAAEENARRVVALEDSLAMQAEQLAQLRSLIVGDVTVVDEAPGTADDLIAERPEGEARESLEVAFPLRSADDPAALGSVGSRVETIMFPYMNSSRRPVPPPVEGVFSRGYEPAAEHYGIDLAADVGTPVHAVGEGVVVLSDWTRAGGNTIAVQHPDGYLSLYKHNQRLLRSVGDWVESRATVALSGNSGEITSGPHLHVEMWQRGSPQDPASFLILPR